MNSQDVTISRNATTGVITVTFTPTSLFRSDWDGSFFISTSKNVNYSNYNKNIPLTVGATLVSISDPINSDHIVFRGVTSGVGITLYNRFATVSGQVALNIRYPSGTDSTSLVGITGITADHLGKVFSFSFKEPFVYEGQFCDPPYKESLDSSNNIAYLLKDRSNADRNIYVQNPCVRDVVRGKRSRLRFCQIHVASTSGQHRHGGVSGDFYAFSYGSNNTGFLYKYKFYCYVRGDGTWASYKAMVRDTDISLEPSTTYVPTNARPIFDILVENTSTGYYTFYIAQTNASLANNISTLRTIIIPQMVTGTNVAVYTYLPDNGYVEY